MADTRSLRRRGRVASRAGSTRSSAILDDSTFLHPGNYVAASHSLRPAESRFSLNEQFALTRREYDFGFDDAASSVFERMTVASDVGRDEETEDTVVIGAEATAPSGASKARTNRLPVHRDYYELLCLPRSPTLSPDGIRRAYLRLFQILHSERQPPYQRGAAAVYFAVVQDAFETLIEPYRRIDYDLSAGLDNDEASILAADLSDESEETLVYSGDEADECDENTLQEQYLNWAQTAPGVTTDFALRTEAHPGPSASRHGQQPDSGRIAPLDFAIRQSTTVGVPASRRVTEKALLFLQRHGIVKSLPQQAIYPIRVAEPTVTVTGGAHVLLADRSRLKSALFSQYTPPGPLGHEPRQLMQLLMRRVLPEVSVKVRQELFWRAESCQRSLRLAGLIPPPDSVVEQELEILPELASSTRITHSLDLPDGQEPVHLEVCVRTGLPRTNVATSVGVAAHRRVKGGTAFMVLDAGSWNLWPKKECQDLTLFSRLAAKLAQKLEPLSTAPTIEAGFVVSPYEMGLRSGRPFTKTANRSVRTLDYDMDDDKTGSWSVSTAVAAHDAAGYLRCGRDLLSLLSPLQGYLLPAGNRSHRWSGLRGEVELGATRQRDFWIAFRALKRIGRFSKLGFEVGLTRYSLYLSLYWSRLGQRFSLPVLLASKSSVSTELAFWTTVVPFATFAALEFLCWRPRSRASKTSPAAPDREALQEHIAKRRSEADQLTAILAAGVESRQAGERQRGGLTILSAKYGVQDAPPDEVADVTVALAALVDNGELRIPDGLRKSRLLGFWDPAPLKTKVLRVTYLYKGREQTIEVVGRQRLNLP